MNEDDYVISGLAYHDELVSKAAVADYAMAEKDAIIEEQARQIKDLINQVVLLQGAAAEGEEP